MASGSSLLNSRGICSGDFIVSPLPLVPICDIRTLPYLMAEPVITSIKIDPGSPSFLIMATDSSWNMLSSPRAVGLVGNG